MPTLRNTQRSIELVRAFRQCWWEMTHTFHCRIGKATVTPCDFAIITGLPFTNSPIFTASREPYTPQEVQNLIGFEGLNKKGKGYRLGNLHSKILERSAAYREDQDWGAERLEQSKLLARVLGTIDRKIG